MKHRLLIITGLIVSLLITSAAGVMRAQGVRGFGPPRGKLPLRGFGNPTGEDALRRRFPEAAAAVIGEDRNQAQHQISRTDANGDGVVTTAEWKASGFQTPGHFRAYDLNGDGKLTLYEHTLGFARWRRRNERRADRRESAARAARPKEKPAISTAVLKASSAADPRIQARERQTWNLSAYVIGVYDTNGNGVVERREFQRRNSRFGNLASADSNRDGKVERRELTLWLRNRLPPLSKLSFDLQSLDADQDGQISLSEYSSQPPETVIAEFNQWDRNRDGLITPGESHDVPAPRESAYTSEQTFVIKPNAVVVAPLWVKEDAMIGDLDVRIVIAKENDNYTAIDLIGPDGRRATLFAGDGWSPWRGAQLLNGVTFSDQAPRIKGTLRQPPNPRAIQPPGVGVNGQRSLRDFNGTSVRGVWRLVVRNQNDRTGLLLRWSLIVTPTQVSK